MRRLFVGVLWVAAVAASVAEGYAQEPVGWVRVHVTHEGALLAEVQVSAGTVGSLTSLDGVATLRLSAGPVVLRLERIGFGSEEVRTLVGAGDTTVVDVELEEEALETEEIVVTSTRADRRIEDEPLRVEVIVREEVEEKLLMTPGDISMLLNETSGVRVQSTAPSLGGASVRIQGLEGRYTLILSDGLPLYGGQGGALGPLQIPPMDLGQVEVIKGAASALYGASALGGVVNLVSRRPEPERELLLNRTTLGGTDGVLWLADDLNERWSYTLLGGVHDQARADRDDDGWADLAGYRRFAARPRLFWEDGRGRSVLATVGGMLEERAGGTMAGALTPDGTAYEDELETGRLDAGLVGRMLLGGGELLLSFRGSGSLQDHRHGFGTVREDDRHATAFGEAALSGAAGPHVWVVGVTGQRDAYRSETLPAFDYTHTVGGLFVQDELTPVTDIVLSASARLDVDADLGAFVNPRVSALFRPEPWTVRASYGGGFFRPTPFVEEVEAVGLSRLAGGVGGLDAERARSGSLDVGRTVGPLEVNLSAFGAVVDDPVQARPLPGGMLELANAAGPVRTWGAEALVRCAVEPVHATLTYAHTRATEAWEGARREVPLTPRHVAGVVAALEQEGRGRLGVELYFTGRQELDENPYRTVAPAHVILGFLVERRFGRARLFLNAENLLDARPTRWDPLVLPTRDATGRWTTDAWAPLEGRVFNGGVRLRF